MQFRLGLIWQWGLLALLLTPVPATAQDPAGRRVASIVSVAVAEYGRAIDERGAVISDGEYAEATGFLADAHDVATRLTGPGAVAARSALEAMILAARQKQPPSALAPLQTRFTQALGPDGVMEIPGTRLDTAAGHKIFAGSCASCHGAAGLGDGAMAHGLSTTVPAIGSAAATPHLTPSLAYAVVSVGVRGTAMAPFGVTLTPEQRWNVVSYIYALRHQPMVSGVGADGTPQAAQAASRILALIDSADALARSGNRAAATDHAFDAYMAFEPLETVARAKNPRLVNSLERSFADFKGAVGEGNLRAASVARDAIVRALPQVVQLVDGTDESASASFWQSFLIILREGFEAILVVGAVVAFLIKTGHEERLHSIWIGVALGVAASLVTAVIIRTLFSAIPASSEIVEAVSLLIAVVVLFSVSYWLISKVEAAQWQRFIRDRVTAALEHGGGGALMLVAFLAVYREGAETALFYQALFSQASGTALPLLLGMLAGFAALAIIFVLFYRFGVRIPMRPFFAVTSLLLYYMAFVFAGRGIRELQEGNVLPITNLPHVPSVEWLGLFPTVETVGIQVILLALFAFALIRTFVLTGSPARGAE